MPPMPAALANAIICHWFTRRKTAAIAVKTSSAVLGVPGALYLPAVMMIRLPAFLPVFLPFFIAILTLRAFQPRYINFSLVKLYNFRKIFIVGAKRGVWQL